MYKFNVLAVLLMYLYIGAKVNHIDLCYINGTTRQGAELYLFSIAYQGNAKKLASLANTEI